MISFFLSLLGSLGSFFVLMLLRMSDLWSFTSLCMRGNASLKCSFSGSPA